MYEIDGVYYAGRPADEHRVLEAKPLTGGMLLVTFSSGERKLFDTTELQGSAFAPLKDEKVFRTAKVEHGFVSWADGSIDIAPEYLYENSVPYEESEDVLCAS